MSKSNPKKFFTYVMFGLLVALVFQLIFFPIKDIYEYSENKASSEYLASGPDVDSQESEEDIFKQGGTGYTVEGEEEFMMAQIEEDKRFLEYLQDEDEVRKRLTDYYAETLVLSENVSPDLVQYLGDKGIKVSASGKFASADLIDAIIVDLRQVDFEELDSVAENYAPDTRNSLNTIAENVELSGQSVSSSSNNSDSSEGTGGLDKGIDASIPEAYIPIGGLQENKEDIIREEKNEKTGERIIKEASYGGGADPKSCEIPKFSRCYYIFRGQFELSNSTGLVGATNSDKSILAGPTDVTVTSPRGTVVEEVVNPVHPYEYLVQLQKNTAVFDWEILTNDDYLAYLEPVRMSIAVGLCNSKGKVYAPGYPTKDYKAVYETKHIGPVSSSWATNPLNSGLAKRLFDPLEVGQNGIPDSGKRTFIPRSTEANLNVSAGAESNTTVFDQQEPVSESDLEYNDVTHRINIDTYITYRQFFLSIFRTVLSPIILVFDLIQSFEYKYKCWTSSDITGNRSQTKGVNLNIHMYDEIVNNFQLPPEYGNPIGGERDSEDALIECGSGVVKQTDNVGFMITSILMMQRYTSFPERAVNGYLNKRNADQMVDIALRDGAYHCWEESDNPSSDLNSPGSGSFEVVSF